MRSADGVAWEMVTPWTRLATGDAGKKQHVEGLSISNVVGARLSGRSDTPADGYPVRTVVWRNTRIHRTVRYAQHSYP